MDRIYLTLLWRPNVARRNDAGPVRLAALTKSGALREAKLYWDARNDPRALSADPALIGYRVHDEGGALIFQHQESEH